MKHTISLSGNLQFLSLADLLQLLGSNGKSGILRLISQYSNSPGIIYLKDGNPVNAIIDKKQGVDALYSLFGWLEGTFEFTDKQIIQDNIIKKSRMEIILDGLRMLDDGIVKKLTAISSSDNKGKDQSNVPFIKGPLVDYLYVANEEGYENGYNIVEQGKHGKWIWVILEGAVEISKNLNGKQLNIAKIGVGGFIGSLSSFLVTQEARSATVTAVDSVQLGVIDSQRLAADCVSLSPTLKNILLSLDNRLKQITVNAVKVYKKENKDYNEKLKGLKPFKLENNKLFMIDKGKGAIIRKNKKGQIWISDLEPGDFIGHVPFFNIGDEDKETIILLEESAKFNEIDIETVVDEYAKLSNTLKNIITHTANCVAATINFAHKI